MRDGMYYAGRVVRILKHGKCGFIRTFIGEEVYYNAKAFTNSNRIPEEGDCVVFQVGKQFDEAKERECFIAVGAEVI